jgi:hypothetical protein
MILFFLNHLFLSNLANSSCGWSWVWLHYKIGKKKKTLGYLCMDLGAKLTNYFNKWFIHATCEIHVTKFWLIGLVDDHECVWVTTSQNWNPKKKKTPWVTYLWILGVKLTSYFNKWYYSCNLCCNSQIWLIPLVDDHQYGYITKLKKKKRKKRRKPWVTYLWILGAKIDKLFQ